MTFRKIDRTAWPRNEVFEHYFSTIPCTYSLTAKLDITNIRAKQLRLYPTMPIRSRPSRTGTKNSARPSTRRTNSASTANCTPATRSSTRIRKPSRTSGPSKRRDLRDFIRRYEADLATYGDNAAFIGKPDLPKNSFTVSMLPWTFQPQPTERLRLHASHLYARKILSGKRPHAHVRRSAGASRRMRRLPCLPIPQRTAGASQRRRMSRGAPV